MYDPPTDRLPEHSDREISMLAWGVYNAKKDFTARYKAAVWAEVARRELVCECEPPWAHTNPACPVCHPKEA